MIKAQKQKIEVKGQLVNDKGNINTQKERNSKRKLQAQKSNREL